MQVIFTNVLILFLLLFLGYWMGISKVVKHTSINDITNILIDVSIPCTIVASMIRPFSQALLGDVIKIAIIIATYLAVISILAYFISKSLKVEKKKQGSWIFALTFSNNAFIGYPLMFALYGNDGLFLMAVGNIIQNLFIFSIGVKMITLNYDLDEKIKLRDVIFTRQNLAVLIGMVIFIGQFTIPKPIVTLITYVSNLTVPLSMMVVGLSLSRYDYRKMFTDFEVYRLTFIRMLTVPALMLMTYKLLGVKAANDLPMAILFFTAALPSPAFTTIMAERYNTSIEFSSKCVFITTIVSIATVPLLAGLL